VQLDMSEYMEKHTVSRLIGSPPGYVVGGARANTARSTHKERCPPIRTMRGSLMTPTCPCSCPFGSVSSSVHTLRSVRRSSREAGGEAATGIAALALIIVEFLVIPTWPKADAATDSIIDFFVEHRTAVLLGEYIGGIGAVVLLLWFFGNPASRLEASPAGDDGVRRRTLGVALIALGLAGLLGTAWAFAARSGPGAQLE
jgi:hypothetical protein